MGYDWSKLLAIAGGAVATVALIYYLRQPAKGPTNDASSKSKRNAEQKDVIEESATPTSPQIDGKAFFRAARGKLSYENFNAFLANIKRLNNHQQTRDQTLDEAKKLFGPDNQDLYSDFQMLLNRHS